MTYPKKLAYGYGATRTIERLGRALFFGTNKEAELCRFKTMLTTCLVYYQKTILKSY